MRGTTQFFDTQGERFLTLYSEKACFQDRLGLFINSVKSAIAPPGSVLDFGCGPGVISLELGRIGYNVFGVDASNGMIEAARANLMRYRLPNVHYEIAANVDWSIQEGAFCGVICSSVLEYIEDDWNLLKMLTGTLRLGGMIAISVPHREGIVGLVEHMLCHWQTYRRRQGSSHLKFSLRRYSRGQLSAYCKKLGISELRFTTFEFPIFGRTGNTLSRCRLLSGMLFVTGRKTSFGDLE